MGPAICGLRNTWGDSEKHQILRTTYIENLGCYHLDDSVNADPMPQWAGMDQEELEAEFLHTADEGLLYTFPFNAVIQIVHRNGGIGSPASLWNFDEQNVKSHSSFQAYQIRMFILTR